MKTSIKFATGAALLLLGATGAVAQNAEYEYYVTGQGDNRMVMSRAGGEGVRLLPSENGVRPGECPTGGFYAQGEESIASCDDDTAFNTEPATGMTMADGQPFAEDALILRPMESGSAKMGEPVSEPETTGSIPSGGTGGGAGGATGGDAGGGAGGGGAGGGG